MSKFLIGCNICGAYQEGSTSFFSRKVLECKCGNVIDVKKERYSVAECPQCANTVMYDRNKGDKAKCFVCDTKLITEESLNLNAVIPCPSCSSELTVNKKKSSYECPLCKTNIDVQAQIKKNYIKNKGLASVIKYDGNSNTLVFKHPIEDFNFGTQLIVHESQEAIFFKDGQALDLYGSGRYTLINEKVPLLNKLYEKQFDGNPFHTELYFINTATQVALKWGTDSKIRMFDPSTGMHIELGACGEFNIRVSNSRKLLLKLVGTGNELTTKDIVSDIPYVFDRIGGKFRTLIVSKVKALLAKSIKDLNVSILAIDEHLITLSEFLKKEINPTLDDYGLEISEFVISSIVTPDDDPNFKRMKEQYAESYLLVREEQIKKDIAMAAQQRKIIEAQTSAQEDIIGAQASSEAYRLQAEAEAREMQMKGYTYQDETKRQVGVAAMENIGNATGGSGGSNSMIGDIVGLGVTLGAVGGVVNMTKDVLNPIVDSSKNVSNNLTNNLSINGWNCKCGTNNIESSFCPNCGTKKVTPTLIWDCSCGTKDITSVFCPNCGIKKAVTDNWNCKCGELNITSNYCPSCGSKKGE